MHKGVLANSEISSFSGAPRAGFWRVRVPADEFDAFVKALAGLGELQRSRQDIQDVTRSHSELEEQIKNMTSEAEGLRELLKKPADKLADTLAVSGAARQGDARDGGTESQAKAHAVRGGVFDGDRPAA
jgi:hypothetical protein